MESKAKKIVLPFIKKISVAPNTYSFFFDRSDAPFDFLPGQYVFMTLPHESPDERGTTRYFTIASSPKEKDILMITTKVIQSTFKKKLASLKKGDEVTVFGPMGTFVLDENDPTPRVFIGGGIGITPFRSMLLSAASSPLAMPITVFLSFSTVEEMLFYQELHDATNRHNHIRIVYTITQHNEVWQGERGRISKTLLKKYITDIHQHKYALVGPSAMVDTTKALLSSLNISEEMIMIEDFNG